ncbi:MAG: hypothetical protein ACJAT7_002006 [Psychromonas sp.]
MLKIILNVKVKEDKMEVIKGFKLANAVLASALALALSGCGDDLVSQNSSTPDTQAPVITLEGEASVTQALGVPYQDDGVTITDNVDTGLVATVVGVDAVNVDEPGTYTITYNVSDAAGNKATEVNRTVEVEGGLCGLPEQDCRPTTDEFNLISSTAYSDIDFSSGNTVGEWNTGSQIAETTYEGMDAWSVTRSDLDPDASQNWGSVLVFQDGINGDFSLFNSLKLKFATSGGYDQYKVTISANGISKEIILPVDDTSSEWQDISIDLSRFALNLSAVDSVAVMGVGGELGIATIYIADLILVKESEIVVDTVTEADFIFKLSDSVESSLVVDDDNNSDVGNVIFGEWSTGTVLADSSYNGLSAWELSAGDSWGAVLALSGDISDGSTVENYDVDFSKYTNVKFKVASEGAFQDYKLSFESTIGALKVEQQISFSLSEQAEWNEIDFDLDSYGVDLSNVNQVAVFGIFQDGVSANQKLYLTDFVAYDSGMPSAVKDSSDDKFVFISSSGENVDIIVDGDDFAHSGNITINDWSTGTGITDGVDYDGYTATELTQGAGWGSVISYAGDIYGGVLPYDLDLNQYSTVNFKIAAAGVFGSYEMAFVTAVGAEFKLPLTVTADWADVTINLADLPLNLMQLNQIAIYGIGGAAGDKIYITDFNISK